ncbi:MAG: CRISPR-associated endonuclease Cas2 [Candidatus Borkfalkiaceae bacterium]|nr:CRISPR-associated endonuclease Cas2 [Christensenellaceae bacterium]
MNNRFMRLLIFFDLPMETSKDRREYSRFHKFLIKSGFIMMQKSVYSKLVINNVTSDAVKQKVADNLPPIGVVELLEVTENQFSRIEYLVGEKQTLVEESMERLIEV